MFEGDPRVIVRTGEEYRTDIDVRTHHVIADEPVAAGGTDLGPSPWELLLASLAACTSVTARMYADRKQWPLTDVQVRVWHTRVTEPDPADPDAPAVRVDVFEIEIDFAGDLDDAQRARLLEIAGRCPVKRALQGPVRISTRLVP
jgi:uncharacterized OsmC-like protein